MNTPVQSKAPVLAMWICLLLSWLLILIPIPGLGLFVGIPLSFVAFIIAIVVMAKGRSGHGIVGLLGTLIGSPLVYLLGLAIFAGVLAVGSSSNSYSEQLETWRQSITQENAEQAQDESSENDMQKDAAE